MHSIPDRPHTPMAAMTYLERQDWAWSQRLEPGPKLVLMALVWATPPGAPHPNRHTVARLTGQSIKTVGRHLQTLQSVGLIRLEGRAIVLGGLR